MTPEQWYKHKQAQYISVTKYKWEHLSMFGDKQDATVCEMAMRCNLESTYLQPANSAELEMVANAALISDFLKLNQEYPNHYKKY